MNGINRFVIHESAHQPLIDKAPGLTLGPCGQWFNRNETWAEQANVWTKYLARNSFLLQQGRFAADVLYFYGEDSNIPPCLLTRLQTFRPATTSTTSMRTVSFTNSASSDKHHHKIRYELSVTCLG